VQLESVVTRTAGCAALIAACVWVLTAGRHFLQSLHTLSYIGANLLFISLLCVLMPMIVIAGVLVFGAIGVSLVKHSADINNVVPLTRATASDLPAPESLVRASEEPPVAPETILLRPLADNPTSPPEQLVRPSETPA
jgi:hypothetical protein